MNTVIVKANLQEIQEYVGKTVVAKVNNKKNAVLFRVDIDDFTIDDGIEAARKDTNILMLNYIGSQEGLAGIPESRTYITYSSSVGNDVTEEDIVKLREAVPHSVTLIVKVPDDFKNIRFLYEMSTKYPNIRFCGGCLFCFDECKFGCCGRDICAARGIKFDDTEYIKLGCSCALSIVNIADVELSVSASGRHTNSKSSGKSVSKSNKAAKFSSLLFSNGKVEL